MHGWSNTHIIKRRRIKKWVGVGKWIDCEKMGWGGGSGDVIYSSCSTPRFIPTSPWCIVGHGQETRSRVIKSQSSESEPGRQWSPFTFMSAAPPPALSGHAGGSATQQHTVVFTALRRCFHSLCPASQRPPAGYWLPSSSTTIFIPPAFLFSILYVDDSVQIMPHTNNMNPNAPPPTLSRLKMFSLPYLHIYACFFFPVSIKRVPSVWMKS